MQSTASLVFVEEDADLIIGLPNDVRITPDGDPIFEGDIVFPREIIPKISHENGSTPSIHDSDTIVTNGLTGRTAIGEPVLYWPDGRIVYTFHSSITPDEKAVILSAIRHWESETCLTFREREPLDVYYIRFRSDAPGCWSLVGRQFLRIGVGQDISIGKGCAQVSPSSPFALSFGPGIRELGGKAVSLFFSFFSLSSQRIISESGVGDGARSRS